MIVIICKKKKIGLYIHLLVKLKQVMSDYAGNKTKSIFFCTVKNTNINYIEI